MNNDVAVVAEENDQVDEDMLNEDDENNEMDLQVLSESTFDMTLATTHSYLGNDLEVLRGRTLLDNGIYVNLPLLTHNAVVLFPGQTLPMIVEYDLRTIEMLRKCMKKNRTFGVASLNFNRGNLPIGTTAEIYEYTESDPGIRMKAKGRQRFQILNIKTGGGGGDYLADVKILPEIDLGTPFYEARLASLDHLRILPSEVTDNKRRDKVSKAESIITPWPAWVYHQYDSHRLVMKIHHYLGIVRSRGSKIPTDPIELSFWVAQNVIMNEVTKKKLLKFDCAIHRLQKEVKILSRLSEKLFACSECHTRIGKQADVFPMNMEGPQSAYCNPHGAIHETVTLYRAESLILRRETPSTEYSWFPGYAWTIACCSICGLHKGWKFTATRSDLKPTFFWGLTRTALVWQDPLKTSDEQEDSDISSLDSEGEEHG